MKKLYAISIVFLCTASAVSQNYVPMLDTVNIWHYTGTGLTVRLQPPLPAASPCQYPGYYGYTKTHYTVHDTILDSLTYKIVREERDLNPNFCDLGYVREDTAARKVFFRDNVGSPEILLYNFSMQVGDTMSVNIVAGQGYYNSGVYQLDSIVTIQTGVNTTRRLFCLKMQSFANTLYWAEGIGCLYDAFYPYATNSNGSGSPFWQCRSYAPYSDGYLTCFDHAQRQYFDSCQYDQAVMDLCFMVTDSCSFGNICGAVAEHGLHATIDVYPNPAVECVSVTFESEEKGEITFTVFDVKGEPVKNQIPAVQYTGGVQTFMLDVSSLPAGSYFLQCQTGHKGLSVPFIVQ